VRASATPPGRATNKAMTDPNVVSSEYPAAGRCEKCDMGTHIDDEGKTACDGCGKPTSYCVCEGAQT